MSGSWRDRLTAEITEVMAGVSCCEGRCANALAPHVDPDATLTDQPLKVFVPRRQVRMGGAFVTQARALSGDPRWPLRSVTEAAP